MTMTAKRGDLVVIERTEHSFAFSAPFTVSARFDVFEIDGVTRTGGVRTVRRLDSDDAVKLPIARMVGFVRAYVVSADRIDKAAAISAVRAHRWPGSDSRMIMPWNSLAEVRDLIRGYAR